MKRFVSTILVLTLMMSMSSINVFAKQSNKKGNGNFIPPGIAKKIFNDSDEVKWAQKAIEKLWLKGLIRGWEGKFLPRNSVTKVEALVMTLRIMDWEEEALETQSLPKEYKGDEVQNWAKGYVQVAYEKGILDDLDIKNFKPHEPAKRYEVAKYIIRALGKEEEAEDCMDKKLPFVDAAAVPEDSVGYVYLINQLGIMTGDKKVFNPMGSLTKAEMAVLFYNLDSRVDTDKDINEYTGVVKEIDDDEITLYINNSNKHFDVSEDVYVYDQTKRIRYSDINKEDKVLVQTEDDEVVYIEIIDNAQSDEKIISKYTGKLIKIKDGNPDQLTVEIKDMTVIFDVLNNVEVYFKKDKGSFDDIKVNDVITVTVDNRNRVRKIYVDRDIEVKEVKFGEIKAIDLIGSYHITINNTNYNLSKSAKVKFNTSTKALDDLDVGMIVKAVLKDNIVTEIYTQKQLIKVEGIIKEVDNNSIEVYINNNVKEYSFSNDMEIDLKDYTDKISSLKEGMKVELILLNNLVKRLYAVDNMFTVNAQIRDIITSNDGYKFKLKVDGKYYIYYVSEDIDLSDIEEGMEGKFEIKNLTIIDIDIDD